MPSEFDTSLLANEKAHRMAKLQAKRMEEIMAEYERLVKSYNTLVEIVEVQNTRLGLLETNLNALYQAVGETPAVVVEETAEEEIKLDFPEEDTELSGDDSPVLEGIPSVS